MKFLTSACLSWLGFMSALAENQPSKNDFPMVIEGVKCSVKAYKPNAPVILEPLVDKDSLPKSQIIIAIMLSHSDISSYMSDEEIFEFSGAKYDKKEAQNYRDRMKKMYELTGSSAADNPWKGVKYVVDQAFVIESGKGKFLVYQLSTLGVKNIGGKLTSSLKNVAGIWTVGGGKDEEGQKFQRSLLELVPAEFAKLHKLSSIELLPFEDLLK